MAAPQKRPLIELPPDTLKRIQTSGDELEIAQRQIDLMKKIGMDTKVLQEKLDWAKSVRTALLEEFSK